MALTRMIFAIQTTDPAPTRLRVRGNVGSPAPTLTCLRRGDSERNSVGWDAGSWEVELQAGDYVVELQAQRWMAGRLDVFAELDAKQAYPIFVRYIPPSLGLVQAGLLAWSAREVHIDPPTSSIIGDSKDPWPPPPPQLTATTGIPLAPDSAAWFTEQLIAGQNRIKSQTADKFVPASVIEALVTEP